MCLSTRAEGQPRSTIFAIHVTELHDKQPAVKGRDKNVKAQSISCKLSHVMTCGDKNDEEVKNAPNGDEFLHTNRSPPT